MCIDPTDYEQRPVPDHDHDQEPERECRGRNSLGDDGDIGDAIENGLDDYRDDDDGWEDEDDWEGDDALETTCQYCRNAICLAGSWETMCDARRVIVLVRPFPSWLMALVGALLLLAVWSVYRSFSVRDDIDAVAAARTLIHDRRFATAHQRLLPLASTLPRSALVTELLTISSLHVGDAAPAHSMPGKDRSKTRTSVVDEQMEGQLLKEAIWFTACDKPPHADLAARINIHLPSKRTIEAYLQALPLHDSTTPDRMFLLERLYVLAGAQACLSWLQRYPLRYRDSGCRRIMHLTIRVAADIGDHALADTMRRALTAMNPEDIVATAIDIHAAIVSGDINSARTTMGRWDDLGARHPAFLDARLHLGVATRDSVLLRSVRRQVAAIEPQKFWRAQLLQRFDAVVRQGSWPYEPSTVERRDVP